MTGRSLSDNYKAEHFQEARALKEEEEMTRKKQCSKEDTYLSSILLKRKQERILAETMFWGIVRTK